MPRISAEDVAVVHGVKKENLPALRTARQMARFLCGITSPAVTRAKLTKHDAFALLTGVPFNDVLAQTESLMGA